MSQSFRLSVRQSKTSSVKRGPIDVGDKGSGSAKEVQGRFIRPPPVPHPTTHTSLTNSSDSSTSHLQVLTVDHPEYLPPLLSGLKIHILPTKLEEDLPIYLKKVTGLGAELVPLPDVTGGYGYSSLPLDFPHLILTVLKGRPRLERLLTKALVDELDILDINWVDEVWKSAQDWVWRRPISAGEFHNLEESQDKGANAILAQLPTLPYREPYRIANTSIRVIERILSQNKLAVCEPAAVAACLTETTKQMVQNKTGMKRKRSGDSQPLTQGPSEWASHGRNATLVTKQPKVLSIPVAGDVTRLDDKSSLLALPQQRDIYPVLSKQPLKRYSCDLPDYKGHAGIEHPDQPNQILSVSKLEQDLMKPEVVEGVRTLLPLPFDVQLEDIPNLSIERCSPLVCVNDDIIAAIKPIYLKREFDAPEEKNANTLSYKRSMSILKAMPKRLTSGAEALRLSGCGSKVAERIAEYLDTGCIEESDKILADIRFRTLRLFSSVFTIGTSTAVELYDSHGCRSLEDIASYYAAKEGQEWDSGVVGDGVPLAKQKIRYGIDGTPGQRGGTYRWKRKTRDAEKRRREGMMSKAEMVREWILIQDELDQKIPRAEVQSIGQCVQDQLDAILPGCHTTLTGGFRRGKLESNDVDIVICPPAPGLDKGLLKSLRTRMAALGMITHVLQLTMAVDLERQTHNNARGNNFDGLDKAFVILRLPPDPVEPRRLHRRVDLIVAPFERYALAVLGWSGSMIFERDLRRHAEDKLGLKFDSGSLHDRRTGTEIHAKTERDIFRIMGLDWVPPDLRNADG